MIWQYWETVGEKPRFIDGLHSVAKANAGVNITLVTPQTIYDYLPDLPNSVMEIKELAHKADMIRARLVHRYGGMWLDSDAIVLRDLSPILAQTQQYDFVGFNNAGLLDSAPHLVRVNCFAARKGSVILSRWIAEQDKKLAQKTSFEWTEVGSDLLHPLCLEYRDKVKILPFEEICPIPWEKLDTFVSQDLPSRTEIQDLWMVMMCNKVLGDTLPDLQNKTIEQIAAQNTYLGKIMRYAMKATGM